MPIVITSAQNPRIKSVIDLREKKTRDKTGLMIVDGFQEIRCALEAKAEFEEIYICRDFWSEQTKSLSENLIARGVECFELGKTVFPKVSFGERMEGIVAVCKKPKWELSDLKITKQSLLVIAEGIEKPGNLGAILRTCDGAGVDGLIVCSGVVDCYNPNVVRASLGTIFSVKVIEASAQEALDFLKKNNISICSTFVSAETVYTDALLKTPLAVVVGAEKDGLSSFWAKHCDLKIKIPMRGTADSLNVSAATAIVIYEALRQNTSH